MTDKARLAFASALHAHVYAKFPGIKDAAADQIVEKVMRDASTVDAINWRIGDTFYLSPTELDRHLERVKPDAALFKQYPTAKDAFAALVEQHKEAHGNEPMPDVKLRLLRQAEAMSEDERAAIAKPGQGNTQKEAPPAHPNVWNDSAAEWDARIEKLTGENVAAMLPSKRRAYIEALKEKPDHINERARQNFEHKAEDARTPQDRLTAHRLEQNRRR